MKKKSMIQMLTKFEKYFNDNLKNKLDEITEKSHEIESEINFYQESFTKYCSEYNISDLDQIDIINEQKSQEINDILRQLRLKIVEIDTITFKLV
jgi:hypothetical protein